MNNMCKETKICITCNEEKSLDKFSIDKTYLDGRRNKCKVCRNKKTNERRNKNREQFNKGVREYRKRPEVKERRKIKYKEHYEKNKDKISIKGKKYRQKPEVKERRRILEYERTKKNPHKVAWRSLLRVTHKSLGSKKEGRTKDELGYSPLELKEHIQSLFTEGMSWDNHGLWHIDHIFPVSKFSKNTHPSVVNNLLNLQPLWAKDNLSKGAKVL